MTMYPFSNVDSLGHIVFSEIKINYWSVLKANSPMCLINFAKLDPNPSSDLLEYITIEI